MRKFLQTIYCWIGGHEWTSAAQEGRKPTELQVMAGVAGFKDYATMYCKHCGKISDLSL
jgi:hypothetical protein